jgi:hypothetical protein
MTPEQQQLSEEAEAWLQAQEHLAAVAAASAAAKRGGKTAAASSTAATLPDLAPRTLFPALGQPMIVQQPVDVAAATEVSVAADASLPSSYPSLQ